MRHTDIAIIGGGLAGSTAAAMLGRAGIDTIIADSRAVYPTDFRCEKLDAGQAEILRRTGLADLVLPNTAAATSLWIARYGHMVDDFPTTWHGAMYHDLVNTVRAAIPAHVPFLHAKAAAIRTGPDRQLITLTDGTEISARVAVLASGPHPGMLHHLGLERRELSQCHSITLGFDVRPAKAGAAFPFPALTYYPEHPSDRAAYITMFPIPGAMRVNYMVYREQSDPWFQEFRADPLATLRAVMPRLERITGAFEVIGPVRVRPADLYTVEGHLQPGIVLVGDAFASSCPAAGTGAGKAINDVERLCNVHIPAWLGTPGMGTEKIAAFYRDPVKNAVDDAAIRKAFTLKRRSIDRSPAMSAVRVATFAARLAAGARRRLLGQAPPRPRNAAAGPTAEAKHA